MPKYYIMLVNRAQHQMIVPVKALLNPYNGQRAYCAGMPQFFGGTDTTDEPPVQVLEKEITQESRRTLELTTGSPSHFYTQGNMFFYWADENGWVHTGTPWGPANGNDEAEMDHLVTVNLAAFNTGMDDNAIIAQLVTQTQIIPAQAQGVADFNASATRPAFIAWIKLYLAGHL